jgi:hypothetical protein
MSLAMAMPIEQRLEREGVVFANPAELRAFFNLQATKLGVSPEQAIKRIESGETDTDLSWAELAQIYLLL